MDEAVVEKKPEAAQEITVKDIKASLWDIEMQMKYLQQSQAMLLQELRKRTVEPTANEKA